MSHTNHSDCAGMVPWRRCPVWPKSLLSCYVDPGTRLVRCRTSTARAAIRKRSSAQSPKLLPFSRTGALLLLHIYEDIRPAPATGVRAACDLPSTSPRD
jgi:hypothetical protein